MLAELATNILTIFKADTSDHRTKVKELTGDEKELAKVQLAAAEQRNKTLDQWISQLGNVGRALHTVNKIVDLAKESYQAYADNLRLTAAAGVVDLGRLSEAAGGLATKHELLTFAAQAQHGAFKLTQMQMETAERAMRALTRAGFEQEKVTKAVTDAVVGLKGDGLKDLGIQLHSTGSDAQKFADIMHELEKAGAGAGDGTLTAGEKIAKTGVTFADAIDSMKQSIGKLVVSLGPLLQALAKVVEYVAIIVEHATSDEGLLGKPTGDLKAQLEAAIDKSGERAREEAQAAELGLQRVRDAMQPNTGIFGIASALGAAKDRLTDPWMSESFGKSFDAFAEKAKKQYEDAKQKAQQIAEERKKLASELAKTATDDLVKELEQQAADEKGSEWAQINAQMDQARAQAELARTKSVYELPGPGSAAIARMKQAANDNEDALKKLLPGGQEKSFLEKHFGKLEDFDAYANAFNMLTGAVTSAMDAWISGSLSAGDAVKKFLGESLKGLAEKFAVEALGHLAYAAGSFAFGDISGGAKHLVAAAAFGTAAAAAAVAARALGHGGADYGKSSSAGGGASSSAANSNKNGTGGSQQQQTALIVYGDAFADDSPRMRAVRARRMVALASGDTTATEAA